MAIAVVGMLDEREEGLQLIKDHIEKRGHRPMLIDISIGTGAIESSLKPDIDCHALAKSGGTTIEKVREMLVKKRDKATAVMADGLGKILQEHHHAGELQGIIAVGGMTGTFISLSAMKLLPFGVPKLLISSVAAMPAYAKKLAEFFGVRDVTVMHSVVDTVGLNPLVRRLMLNGAGAICGMVETQEPAPREEKRSIALTEFGFCDKGAHYVREMLENDFSIISFHATGIGEKAAMDLVGQGLFEAFIDMVPAGFSEYLFDMISCGPIQRRDDADPLWTSRNLAARKLLLQDAIRVQARTSVEEMQTIAQEVAKKLNQSKNKKLIKFILPTKGFSSLSVEGGALYEPVSDKAFIEALKKSLDDEINVIEVDADINTPEFARAVVDALHLALGRN
jgi:uncharacterized protein (UPF0261 family)